MHRRSRWLLVAGVMATASAVAGCGSSSKSSSSTSSNPAGVPANVQQTVAAAKAPVSKFTGPTSSPKPPAGKKIYVITCGAVGNCQRAAQGVQQAGAILGWPVQVINGKGDPAVWTSGIENAISSGASGIVLAAVPPPLVVGALQKAKAANVPVVSVFTGRVPSLGNLVYAYMRGGEASDGKQMADWVIEASGGKAKIASFVDPEFPEIAQRDNAFAAEIKASCPGCSQTITKFSLATMATSLASSVTATLKSNPDTEYVVVSYDPAAPFALQGIRQAGDASKIKLAGYEGDPDVFAAIRSGSIAAADIAEPGQWMGFQAVDMLNRAFAHLKTPDWVAPRRLFDKTNLPSDTANGWNGDVDYASYYRKLWGK